MEDKVEPASINLKANYQPVALYFDEADAVEYLRKDVPCVYRRIDAQLTHALDMDTGELIGIRIKGFKNFYLRQIKPIYDKLGGTDDFVSLVAVLERLVEHIAGDFFDERLKRAYLEALELAKHDRVQLHDLPRAA